MTGDGKFIVSGSEDRSIKIFDLKTKQLVHWFKDAHNGLFRKGFFFLTFQDAITSLAVSTYNGCSIIVSASSDKSIKVFDLQTRQQIHHFRKVHTGESLRTLYFICHRKVRLSSLQSLQTINT